MAFSEEEIAEFKMEALELLDKAEQSLLAMESGGESRTGYDAVFRAFHSIKGAAGMMELTALQSHVHQLETQLTRFKENAKIPKEYVDLFLRGADAARSILDGKKIQFSYEIAPSPSQTVVERPVARERTPYRALVVDDEPELVTLLCEVLNGAGLETKGTSSPKQALEWVKSFAPQVVLSDIRMPEMEGPEMVRRIREQDPYLPVILVSAHIDKQQLMKSVSLGLSGAFEKPFNSTEVTEAALSSAKRYEILKLLNTSVNLILFQFSDLDAFLAEQGREDARAFLRMEIDNLLVQRRELVGQIKRANR